MTITEKEARELADWAENEMNPTRGSVTALRGEAAAAFGRETIERALGGRPSIDPHAAPGQHSRTRQVRLPQDLDAWLVRYAASHKLTASDVLRDALNTYADAHRAS
jgi:hypothetical protein